MALYSFHEEPRGGVYRELIGYGARVCTAVLLVVRPGMQLEPTGVALIERLRPHLRMREERASWPGTTLHSGTGAVLVHSLTADVVQMLLDASGCLFAWQQPGLPEDLCLLRENETPWLTTIAHEYDGYLDISEIERARLLVAIPELGDLLRATPDPQT